MPLNTFSSRQFPWLDDYQPLDFLSEVIKGQKRIANYDDAMIFTFLQQNGLNYANDFILVLTSDDELRLAKGDRKFQPDEVLLLINEPNQQNLQSNGTIKQPLSKRQLRGLRKMSQNELTNFNLELNGIYQQLLHMNDLFFEQDESSSEHVFNFRVYPAIYQYVLREYNLPTTADQVEKNTQIMDAVADILRAYLWVRIIGLTNGPAPGARTINISHLLTDQKFSTPLERVDYLQLNTHFYGEL